MHTNVWKPVATALNTSVVYGTLYYYEGLRINLATKTINKVFLFLVHVYIVLVKVEIYLKVCLSNPVLFGFVTLATQLVAKFASCSPTISHMAGGSSAS